jgi:DNA-binding FadR family transcriptional regulator
VPDECFECGERLPARGEVVEEFEVGRPALVGGLDLPADVLLDLAAGEAVEVVQHQVLVVLLHV